MSGGRSPDTRRSRSARLEEAAPGPRLGVTEKGRGQVRKRNPRRVEMGQLLAVPWCLGKARQDGREQGARRAERRERDRRVALITCVILFHLERSGCFLRTYDDHSSMDSNDNSSTVPAAAQEGDGRDGFLDNILTPGSSLNPTFLFIVDGALGLLLVVLLSLFILTRGNLHLLFLMAIECCLWASIKWYVGIMNALEDDAYEVPSRFVHELQHAPSQDQTPGADGDPQPGPKLKDE